MSTIHKITPESAPVFPCWLWGANTHSWLYYSTEAADRHDSTWLARTSYTHWSPDSPTAPTERPDGPKAVFLDCEFYSNNGKTVEENAALIAGPSPAIPPTPEGTGTPTPRTDTEEERCFGSDKLAVELISGVFDFARTLERELSATQAELAEARTENARAHEECTNLNAAYQQLAVEHGKQMDELAALKSAPAEVTKGRTFSDSSQGNAMRKEFEGAPDWMQRAAEECANRVAVWVVSCGMDIHWHPGKSRETLVADVATAFSSILSRHAPSREDSARLDWLEAGGWGILSGWNSTDRLYRVQRIEYDPPTTTIASEPFGTIRLAIDAAMKEAK